MYRGFDSDFDSFLANFSIFLGTGVILLYIIRKINHILGYHAVTQAPLHTQVDLDNKAEVDTLIGCLEEGLETIITGLETVSKCLETFKVDNKSNLDQSKITKRRVNGAPTLEEVVRTTRLIQHLDKDIETCTIRIDEATSTVETCEKAIFNLEAGIGEGRKQFAKYEGELKQLIGIEARSSDRDNSNAATVDGEVRSRAMVDAMRRTQKNLQTGLSSQLGPLIANQQKELRQLYDHVQNQERELDGYQFTLRLTKSELKELVGHREKSQEHRLIARDSLNPVRRTPEQVWSYIFEYTVVAELADYMQSQEDGYLQLTVLRLSHVCSFWRYIVNATPSVWSSIPFQPNVLLHINEHKFTGPLLGRLPISPYSAVKLSRVLSQHRADGNATPNRTPNSFGLTRNTYELIIVLNSDQVDMLPRTGFNHLNSPSKLLLSSPSSTCHQSLSAVIQEFRSIEHLSISCPNPRTLPSDLAVMLPNLKILEFEVDKFPQPFDISGCLSSNLQELYIRHDSGPCPSITGRLRLPHLVTIGFTPTLSNVLGQLEVPSLKRAILYGPKQGALGISMAEQCTIDNRNRICTLEFEDWKTTSYLSEVVHYLRSFAPISKSLHTVKFTRSHLNGEALVALIEFSLQPNRTETFDMVHHLVFQNTEGISEGNCHRLRQLGMKVKVLS